VRADLVAFPDDDCVYPDDLLEQVADRFHATPTLDGLTGREIDGQARSSPSWARDAAVLTRENLWNRAISFTIFLRAAVVANVGPFDERLGLGATATPIDPLDVMPAPGQGALGIEVRAADKATAQALRPLHDVASSTAVTAERAVLHALFQQEPAGLTDDRPLRHAEDLEVRAVLELVVQLENGGAQRLRAAA